MAAWTMSLNLMMPGLLILILGILEKRRLMKMMMLMIVYPLFLVGASRPKLFLSGGGLEAQVILFGEALRPKLGFLWWGPGGPRALLHWVAAQKSGA